MDCRFIKNKLALIRILAVRAEQGIDGGDSKAVYECLDRIELHIGKIRKDIGG